MFNITAYTIGCNPTRSSEASTFDDAVEEARVFLDWIIERAFGAGDTAEIDGKERDYVLLREDLDQHPEITVGKSHEFGPLPDGYCIKIENVADAEGES